MLSVLLTCSHQEQLSREEKVYSFPIVGKLVDLHPGEDGADPNCDPPNDTSDDFQSVYESFTSVAPLDKTVILQSLHKIQKSDSLFYTTVTTAEGVMLRAMIDSGSMACTLSESAESRLLQQNPDMERHSADDIIIIEIGRAHV